ncbi:MAG: hypothetical protein PHI93_10900 [Kiritimatiellae bacterium]|nr:hypothetical protein [Kiritimatiellia bacterium]
MNKINLAPVSATFLSPSSALALALAIILAPGAILLANPPPGAAIVMVDDERAYPSNSIALPSHLQQLQQQLTPLYSQAVNAWQQSGAALDIAQQAYDSIRFIDASNIVSSTAYITSIGSQQSAGTNQLIKIYSMRLDGDPITNIHLIATFDKLQTVSPAVDWRSSLTANGSSTGWAAITNVTCSWPTTVSLPGADTPFIYSFDVPAPSPAKAMFRILSMDDGGGGTGLYFLFYNFISVNGRVGWTGTLVDNNGTQIEIKGGIAAEPFSE